MRSRITPVRFMNVNAAVHQRMLRSSNLNPKTVTKEIKSDGLEISLVQHSNTHRVQLKSQAGSLLQWGEEMNAIRRPSEVVDHMAGAYAKITSMSEWVTMIFHELTSVCSNFMRPIASLSAMARYCVRE